MSKPRPYLHFLPPGSFFSLLWLSCILFASKAPTNISSGPLSVPEPFLDLNMIAPPQHPLWPCFNFSCDGQMVRSAGDPHLVPPVTTSTLASALRPCCYLGWELATAVGSSWPQLPTVLPKHTAVSLATPLLFLGQQAEVCSVLRQFGEQ